MRRVFWWIIGWLLVAPAAHALSGDVVSTDNVKARLVSETTAIGPGQAIWVALELDIRDGWHTYWRNPGDSGEATTLTWHLPPGFTAGEINWPAPHRFELPPLVNYGYSGRALHLIEVRAPADLRAGTAVTLAAKASWLVCADVCIPGNADLALTLPAISPAGPLDAHDAVLFTAARAELPQQSPAAASAAVRDGKLTISLKADWGPALSQIRTLAFYPYADNGIDYGAPQILTRSADGLQLTVKVGDRPPTTGAVRGVLLAGEQSGEALRTVPIEIAAELGAAAPTSAATSATTSIAETASPRAASEVTSVPSLILLAVLGGLILNLMPCVFPVLSIKAIGLVEQAKKHPAAVRTKGLMFAAGVVSSMLALAVALLLLRAGGEKIGWGFQLQSPLFVTLMVYLLLAVGLNLSGVFEVGGGLAGVGDGLTRGDTYRASFFTGVLTTLVATPCTAPFMAAAVGAALTQSPPIALLIFASLGLGLSLPYLLLSFAPWTRRALPKPGAWMDTLKQIFAFPMYASAAWLLWVLAQQTSPFGLAAALAGTILIGMAAWAYQKSKFSGRVGRLAATIVALACLVLAILLPLRQGGALPTAAGTSPAREVDEWQPYDAGRLAQIRAAGDPVLVNFTASWCLTCLVNERNAFADTSVQAVFRDKGVTLMKGDWTNRDPAITSALASFGRAGVPLYVIYNAGHGAAEPMVLPQLLTANIVQAAFARLPNRGLK